MRRRRLFRCLIALTITASLGVAPAHGSAAPAPRAPQPPESVLPASVPGITIVKTRTPQSAEVLGRRFGVSASHVSRGKNNTAKVRTPAGRSDEQFREELARNADVEYACPVYFRTTSAYTVPPNDPDFGNPREDPYWDTTYLYVRSWWLRSQGMSANTLWQLSNDVADGVKAPASAFPIAVLDTGFYLDHPDRGSNIVPKRDEFESYRESTGILTSDLDVSPIDVARALDGVAETSHGTFTAGMLGAATNNGTGMASMTYDMPVWIYKVHGLYYNDEYPQGVGAIIDAAVIDAIYDATDAGAKIISMSFGGDYYSPAVQDAIDYAHERGVLLCAAVGNQGLRNGVQYPAANDHVVGVGAYGLQQQQQPQIAPFTNYENGKDPAAAGRANGALDVLAPGVRIWSLVKPGFDADGHGYDATPGYAFMDGTSMAAPAVAGLAAFLWRFAPSATPDQVAASITGSTGKIPFDNASGIGYAKGLDAYRLLRLIQNDTVPPVAPQSFALTQSSPGFIKIMWNPVPDLSGISGYAIYTEAGVRVASFPAWERGHVISGLAEGMWYGYYVTAIDNSGNESVSCPIVTAKAGGADTEPPATPTGLTATATSPSSVYLRWDSAGPDTQAFLVYSTDGTLLRTQGRSTSRPFQEWTATGLTAGTSYGYYLRARDAANNLSAPTAPLDIVTLSAADTTPPPAPLSISVTPVGDSALLISWEAVTDPTGIAAYSVVCGARSAYVTLGNECVIRELAPGTTFAISVTARDGAGNYGPQAAVTAATAADTTPPNAPPSCSGTPYTNSVTLTWGETGDSSGIAKYTIRRGDGSFVADIGPNQYGHFHTTHSVSGLAAATLYRFFVTATDRAGNTSPASVTALAVTHDPAYVPNLYPVYRFYNFTNNTHFYTPSAEERDMVISRWPNVFSYEGAAYYANAENNTHPLYRFYNRKNGSHFYTASADEADAVLAKWPETFSYDGQTYAVNLQPVRNSVPVYRFYNVKNGTHFYTASEEERSRVATNLAGIYQYEGPAFWVGQ